MSYGELDAMALGIAARLGHRPGVVGVPTARSPRTVGALLGILTAGGAYCPLDPAYPEARRSRMIDAAGCSTILSPLPAPRADEVTPAPVDGDDVAYVLFTSGSTGEPKPVLTPRRAISATVDSLRDLFGLTPADRVLQFASLNWDTCFEEILPTLTAGATLVFDDEAYTGSFPRFLRMIERQRITVLDLPTAFWHELVLHLVESGQDGPGSDERAAHGAMTSMNGTNIPGCVRVLIIGGEAASPARLAQWRSLPTGHIRLVNTYGCTETTLITHAIDLHGPAVPAAPAAAPVAETGRVPIGHVLPHVTELVTDEGELLIGGPSIALGYGGLLEASAARFVTLDGERFFRTGDRVTATPGGALLHEGRMDGEVKIRGIRVDPAEVEAHIAGHPGVTSSAVVGATVADRTTLVAYVVARPDVDGTALGPDLLAFLRERVPGHLVPTKITIVPALAHTTSGKVDRTGTHRRHTAREQVKESLR
jgi:non-ribosomal peptide synthetase component F